MNGRVYCPTTGRFLSPDNYVQAPDMTQSLNRFSYCLNNPLKYTDPSGNCLLPAMFIGAFINFGLEMASGHINSFGDCFKAMAVGALAGLTGDFAGGLVSNSIKTFGGFAAGALIGGASGAAGGFVSGAGNAWMQGANFSSGLNAGLNGALAGGVTGGIAGGLIRGFSDYSHGYSFLTGTRTDEILVSHSTVPFSSSNQQNDKLLKNLFFEKWGIEEGDMGKDEITSSPGYGRTLLSNGYYSSLTGGDSDVSGFVEKISTGYESVHISPRVIQLGGVEFEETTGHELLHVYQNYTIPSPNVLYMERACYNYSTNVYLKYDRFYDAMLNQNMALKYNFLGSYPSNYYSNPNIFKFLYHFGR